MAAIRTTRIVMLRDSPGTRASAAHVNTANHKTIFFIAVIVAAAFAYLDAGPLTRGHALVVRRSCVGRELSA
jgi:hypothetical protein